MIKRFYAGLSTAFIAFLYFSMVGLGQSSTTGAVNRNANLRSGPGTTYAIVGTARQGQSVTIMDTNEAGDWYQLTDGQWIAAFLVNDTNRTLAPTATAVAPSGQPAVVATALPAPSRATATRNANLRAGPGTAYAIIGTVRTGQALTLTGRNSNSSWYQLEGGAWIAAFLVDQSPSRQPVATPSPTVSSPTVASPTAAPPPVSSGNEFVLVQKRLWDPYENGGSLDGPSVHCGYRRQLVVNVLDASGNRVNGVAVQVQYGARETEVTGAQGRGDGVAEFVLGGGQDVKVIRDASGQAVTSDLATGLSTNPQNIPFETLISAQYCQDEATCRNFAETNSCNGHFSWTVTFQRSAN